MPVLPFYLDKDINDIETSNDQIYIIFTTLSIWCLFIFIGFSKKIHTLEKEHSL